MRLFGVKTGHDRPTDREYIEQVRKYLRLPHWLRYFYTVLGLAMILMTLFAIQTFVSILGLFGGAGAAPQNLVLLTFFVAILLGFLVGQWFHNAVQHIILAWCEPRKDRLLVNCWDAMHRLLDETPTPPNESAADDESPSEGTRERELQTHDA